MADFVPRPPSIIIIIMVYVSHSSRTDDHCNRVSYYILYSRSLQRPHVVRLFSTILAIKSFSRRQTDYECYGPRAAPKARRKSFTYICCVILIQRNFRRVQRKIKLLGLHLIGCFVTRRNIMIYYGYDVNCRT